MVTVAVSYNAGDIRILFVHWFARGAQAIGGARSGRGSGRDGTPEKRGFSRSEKCAKNQEMFPLYYSQIRLAHFGVIYQGFAFIDQNDFPCFQNIAAVGNLQCLNKILLDNKHGFALIFQAA